MPGTDYFLKDTATKVLETIESINIGADEQANKIADIIRNFQTSGCGGSCIVTGESNCGQNTLYRLVSKNGVDVCVFSGSHLASDAGDLQLLKNDSEKQRIVIIDNADELVFRQKQTVLYTILNTKNFPWLIFLMVNKQDFISAVEKRIRSRVPMSRIHFQPAQTLSDYTTAAAEFLGISNNSNEWCSFITNFLDNQQIKNELVYMYSFDPSFSTLKKCVAVFLSFFVGCYKEESEDILIAWRDAVKAIVPSEYSIAPVIRSLPLCSLCVLLCILRQLRNAHINVFVTYRQVFIDYLRLGNTVDRRICLSEIAVYKTIDRLVQLGVLVVDQTTNDLAFRRASLSRVPKQVLEEIIKSITLPVPVRYWYDDLK